MRIPLSAYNELITFVGQIRHIGRHASLGINSDLYLAIKASQSLDCVSTKINRLTSNCDTFLAKDIIILFRVTE
jgi:hypothetical protein